MWVTKLLISPVKSALLVGRLVVVARGLYLARQLFTLSLQMSSTTTSSDSITTSNLLPPKLERGVRVFYHIKRWPPPKLRLLDKPPAFEGAAG